MPDPPTQNILAATSNLACIFCSDWRLVTSQANCLIQCNTYGISPRLGWVASLAVCDPKMQGTVIAILRCLDTSIFIVTWSLIKLIRRKKKTIRTKYQVTQPNYSNQKWCTDPTVADCIIGEKLKITDYSQSCHDYQFSECLNCWPANDYLTIPYLCYYQEY